MGGSMIIEDDPEILVSDIEDVSTFQSLSRRIDSDSASSDEEEPFTPISLLKRLSSKRRTECHSDKGLQPVQDGLRSRRGDDAAAGRKAEAQPELKDTTNQSNTSSIPDDGRPPSFTHKVKLRRDRLVDAETIPGHLKAVTKRNQVSSPFLRLPFDITHKIYKLALGGRHIEIHYQPHVHRWRQKNKQRFKEHIPGGLYCRVISGSDRQRGGDFFKQRGVYPIARTCRQIYYDTALFYYSLNKFSFDNEWVMKKWMKSLVPVQKRAITRLVLPGTFDVVRYILKDLNRLKTVEANLKWITSESQMKEFTALWNGRGISVVFI